MFVFDIAGLNFEFLRSVPLLVQSFKFYRRPDCSVTS